MRNYFLLSGWQDFFLDPGAPVHYLQPLITYCFSFFIVGMWSNGLEKVHGTLCPAPNSSSVQKLGAGNKFLGPLVWWFLWDGVMSVFIVPKKTYQPSYVMGKFVKEEERWTKIPKVFFLMKKLPKYLKSMIEKVLEFQIPKAWSTRTQPLTMKRKG